MAQNKNERVEVRESLERRSDCTSAALASSSWVGDQHVLAPQTPSDGQEREASAAPLLCSPVNGGEKKEVWKKPPTPQIRQAVT